MKILSPSQLKITEAESVRIQGITLTDLMDRAAWALFSELKKQYKLKKTHFTLICGPGNNGGDGLVLALMLTGTGAGVKVFLTESPRYSADNLYNQKRVEEAGINLVKFSTPDQLYVPIESIVVDSLFGYGLNRPLEGNFKELVLKINKLPNEVISVDVPSGMYSDRLNSEEDAVIHATRTLTLHSPKFSFFLPENERCLGEFKVLDIGLDSAVCEQLPSDYFYTLSSVLKPILKPRGKFTYKYKFGNLLVIAGSYGKIGAAVLTAKAAFRAGAGLVTVYLPKCGYTVMQTSVPEAMVLTDFSEDKIIGFPDTEKFDTLAIGPGLGTNAKTASAFLQFLEETDLSSKKLIIDADGINLLAESPDLLNKLPPYTILTPQDKELEGLIGRWRNSVERIEKASAFAQRHQLVLIGKGPYSQIYAPDGKIYFNSTGNPGMATAGSGDVLTGIMAGIAAQGYTAVDAARLAIWLHGRAGDREAKKLVEESLIASDLIRFLPYVLKKLKD